MKKTKDETVSSALRNVWSWKEAVFRETETLSTAEALKQIHSKADVIRSAFRLKEASPTPPLHFVCEEPAEYKTKRDG